MHHTIVCVLSSNLGHSIANLLPDISNRLASQACDQFLPDDQPLVVGESRKDFLGFVRDRVFFCFGRYSSEKHRRECTCLLPKYQ